MVQMLRNRVTLKKGTKFIALKHPFEKIFEIDKQLLYQIKTLSFDQSKYAGHIMPLPPS